MLEKFTESAVKEKIDSILSSREFADGRNNDGLMDKLANWIKSIVEWLKDRFNSIRLPDNNISLLPESSISPEAVLTMKIIAIVILAAVLAAVSILLFRRLKTSKKILQEEDQQLILTLKDPDRVLETALEHSKAGDFRQGLRYLYISLILHFNEQNLIRIDKSKTNRQYMNELREAGFGPYEEVVRFTRAFNDHWYGLKNLDATAFDFWYGKYAEFRKEEGV